MASVCYPMSIDNSKETSALNPVYAATSEEDVVRLSSEEKVRLHKALLDTVPDFRSQLRIITPLSSLYALCRQYTDHPKTPYPCRGGIDFFFIDAKEGNTYPCGYRSNENLGKFWDLDVDALGSRATCYLKYYQACEFFDGRRSPDPNRLRNFRESERGMLFR